MICDKKIPTKLKLLIYQTVIRPDFALRMRNMANVSQGRKAYGNNRDENGAMGNGREPVRTPEKRGNLGRSKDGSDSDGYETEKAGMVWTRQKER